MLLYAWLTEVWSCSRFFIFCYALVSGSSSGYCYRFLELIITESFSGLSANHRWSSNQRFFCVREELKAVHGEWQWDTQVGKHGGNRTAIFYNETDISLFFNNLSVTPITVEVHQDAVSSDRAESECPTRQTWLPWQTLPVKYPSQSHWPQPPPHLAHRWLDKCIFQELERFGTQYLFAQNGQWSKALHEKMIKHREIYIYINNKRWGGGAPHGARNTRNISGRKAGLRYWQKTLAKSPLHLLGSYLLFKGHSSVVVRISWWQL